MVDILCFGCMELKKILFDFHKKSKPRLVTIKNLDTPLSFTLKKWLPRCILHRPRHTVNFSSPLKTRTESFTFQLPVPGADAEIPVGMVEGEGGVWGY